MPSPTAKTALALLAGAVVSLTAARASADDVDAAIGRLIRLDLRVHVMALEFNEAPAEPADLADRRVLDAQALRGLGRGDEAIALLLSVVARWPRTLAARDATFELGDALFEDRDFLSARSYYEAAVSLHDGTEREGRALVRLLEIALRTGDFTRADEYFGLLAARRGAALAPAAVYVEAKVLYYRGRVDEASRLFAEISSASEYGLRARYFEGTILVGRGDLPGAARAFEGLLPLAAPDDAAREIQDLARVALGRISYERGDAARAATFYESVAADSKIFPDALYELGWTYVRAGELERATSVLERLSSLAPSGPHAPEVKVLVANLHLRRGDLEAARTAFARAREEVEPAYLALAAVIARSQADPVFFEILTSRTVDGDALAPFVPASARSWVRGDPEIERLLTLARDVGVAEGEVAALDGALVSLRDALGEIERDNRLALFPDLARVRLAATAAFTELEGIRDEFAARARRLVQPYLLDAEARRLDLRAREHAGVERQLERSLALVGEWPAAVARGAATSQARFEAGEARRAMTLAAMSGAPARLATVQLRQLSREEPEIAPAMLSRLGAAERKQVSRELEVVSRADASISQLLDLDARLDAEGDLRAAALDRVLVARAGDVAAVDAKLGSILSRAQGLGGGLARVMYTRVADRLYDLVVRADVGLIDVAWAVKARRSAKVRGLVVEKVREQAALEAGLLDDEAALSRRFDREAAWAKTATAPREPAHIDKR